MRLNVNLGSVSARWRDVHTGLQNKSVPFSPFRVARSMVYRWVERYLDVRRPSALADGTRGGRPSVATALTKRKLIALLKTDPRRFGYDANTWTVPLLTAHLQSEGIQISARTLRRRIRAAHFRWKRPRYVYRERAAHVGAKKGGSSAA